MPAPQHISRSAEPPASATRQADPTTNIEQPLVVEGDANAGGVPQQDQAQRVDKLQQHRVAAQVALWSRRVEGGEA